MIALSRATVWLGTPDSMASKDDTKAAVRCANCGAIFAARVRPDGTIDPIGRGDRCSCDAASLEVLEGHEV